MTSIDQLFAKLRSENRKALMPFITAGDPDVAFTSAVLQELVKRGAHMCEVGIPYSDPIADGPVIQASYTRALEKKIKLRDILTMLSETTPKLAAPAVTMNSAPPMYSFVSIVLTLSRERGAATRSDTSGTPIRATTLAKKPRTTRRRAMSSGMPRACR